MLFFVNLAIQMYIQISNVNLTALWADTRMEINVNIRLLEWELQENNLVSSSTDLLSMAATVQLWKGDP